MPHRWLLFVALFSLCGSAEVVKAQDRGLDNQWRIVKIGNLIQFKNRVSNLCLGVLGVDSHRPRGRTEVYHCNPGGGDPGLDNQWRLEKVNNQYYYIRNSVSDLCLGVSGVDSHRPGVRTEVYHCDPSAQ